MICAVRRRRLYSPVFFSTSKRAASYVLEKAGMTWLAWLLIAVIVAAFAALTGIKPKGSRPVAHTRLMGVARFVFVVILLIVAYVVFRARSGT